MNDISVNTSKNLVNDCISRQAAIDAAIDAVDSWDGSTNIGRQKRIEKYINVLPPAQQWIPCTPETMPEKEGRYVCTYTYDGKKDVFMFRFENGDFLVPWYVDTITAWYKPLDPWEGEQDG